MDSVPLRARCDLCYENIDCNATPIVPDFSLRVLINGYENREN